MLRKLENGKLVQIDLHHDEDGERYATVYGVRWKIPHRRHDIIGEIFDELDVLSVQEAKILTDKSVVYFVKRLAQ
jgi:hypothetical protein